MFTKLIEREAKLKQAKEVAQNKGGECLSTEYVNAISKLIWKCSEGHIWDSTYKNVVKRGCWCSKCSTEKNAERRRNKNGLLNAQEQAKSRGGECLSKEYINALSKLEWKCSKNHVWKASYASVIKGIWCNKCGRKTTSEKLKNKNGLLNAQKYAQKKNGECLSEEYLDSLTKLKWKCSKNHIWEATYNNVVNHNRWCNKCAIKTNAEKLKNKNGLLNAQEQAKSRGGECLSEEYISSNKVKMTWKCSNGHIWEASYSSVMKGSWCPNCSYYYYKEHKIRDLLEYFLDTKFIKSHPKWNINPVTNRCLELDGYSEKLKIAFEYQGDHHYKEVFKGSDLEYIKYKDNIKKQNCSNNGVKLIIIDDKFKLNQEKEIVDYIINLLNENNIEIKKEIKQEDINKIFKKVVVQQKIFLEKAKELAESKDGYCLSDQYFDAKTKLKWECKEKHVWDSLYYSVVEANQWCPQCAIKTNAEQQKNKNGLELAKKYALEKGGECLSTEYVDSRSKIKWKCLNNHIWEARYNNVLKKNQWCPMCAKEKVGNNRRNKNGLELAKKYALDRGGECLSEEYINNSVPMKWRCSNNHMWDSSYRNVVTGKAWCWDCYQKRKNK